MTQNITTKLFILSMLVLLAALPAAVLAQEGEEAMADEAMMAQVSCQQDYTVQADDWLSKIAEKFYGDVLAFPAIAQATNTHYEAAMMAEGDEAMAGEAMAEDEAMMAEDEAMMAEDGEAMAGEAMAEDEAMMAEDGEAMAGEAMAEDEAMMAEDGEAMAGEAMAEDEAMMAEDGEAMAGEAMAEDEAMMAEDEAMMAEDEAMAGEAMAEDEAMMAEEEAMMAGGYSFIENPDLIEPGWVLCIPNAEDAQKLLAETAAMAK